jgi:hypothetical protein
MIARRPWSASEEQQLRDLAQEGLSAPSIAARIGRSRDQVFGKARRHGIALVSIPDERNTLGYAPPVPVAPPAAETIEGDDQKQTITFGIGRITNLDQLLAVTKVDLTLWRVDHYAVNTWEMGAKLPSGLIATETLYQVKAYLKRAETSIMDLLDRFKAGLLADIRAANAKKKEPVYREVPDLEDPVLLEVSVFDLHVNKQAWEEESGDHYDTDTAKQRALGGVRRVLRLTQQDGVTKVLFPVGNDLFNVDTLTKTTTGGTPQDTHTRALQMFREGVALWREAIDLAAKQYPVHVIIVPGNHDMALAFFLGEVLAAIYEGSTRVTVDNGPKLRKYFRWGRTLLGFTHGNEEKHADLPLIMATEAKADSDHHEWHLGHYHKAKETRFVAGDSFGGVRVRILPSLSGTDAWHYKRGYVGETKALEAYLWGKKSAYAGHRSINATTLDQAA